MWGDKREVWQCTFRINMRANTVHCTTHFNDAQHAHIFRTTSNYRPFLLAEVRFEWTSSPLVFPLLASRQFSCFFQQILI